MKKYFILSSVLAASAIGVFGAGSNAVRTNAEATEDWTVVGQSTATVTDVDGGAAINLSGWNSQVVKAEKVALNGLEFTMSSVDAGSTSGFFFTQDATVGRDTDHPFFTNWNNTWISGQARGMWMKTHDWKVNAPCNYTSMDKDAPDGFSTESGQLIMNGTEMDLKFKFELVADEWFKLTITDLKANAIWGAPNYTSVGGSYAYTYIKKADIALDESGKAYLGFWCVDAANFNCLDFKNGKKINPIGWSYAGGAKADVALTDNGVAVDLNGWNSCVTKDDKVCLNGLEFTLSGMAAGTTPGFYFTSVENGGRDTNFPFFTNWNNTWISGQARGMWMKTHDWKVNAPCNYTAMDKAAPDGFSTEAGQLIMNGTDMDLKFRFDLVTQDWFKLTITDLKANAIWGAPNYTSVGGSYAYTYIKRTDLDIDENYETYMGIWCVDQTQLKVLNFKNGSPFVSEPDTNWTLIAGDAAANTAMTDLKGTAIKMNGWQAGFYYNKEKVCANGFEITLNNLQKGNSDVFYFSNATDSTAWSGPIVSVWNGVSFAPAQCRVQIALNHDPASGSICYKDTKDANPSGLSGADSLVIDAVDDLTLTFKFERLNFDWWKVTITNKTNTHWTSVNYNISEDGKVATTYIKHAAFTLGEQDDAYLHVETAGTSSFIASFTNGTYVHFVDEKGNPTEMAKLITDMEFVGFPESFNETYQKLVNEAIEEIKTYTLKSDMQTVVDGFRAKVQAAYQATIYTADNTQFDGVQSNINYWDVWGFGASSLAANRVDDEALMLGITPSFGARGALKRTYDAKNFTTKFNLGQLAIGDVFVLSVSQNNACPYANEDTKLFSIDIYKASARDYTVIISTTIDHNISIAEWNGDPAFHGSFVGKNVVSDSGNFLASFITSGNNTVVSFNDVTVTIPSASIYGADSATKMNSYFSFGVMNGNAMRPILLSYVRDAASIAYLEALENTIDRVKDQLLAAYETLSLAYTTKPDDESYAAWVEAYNTYKATIEDIINNGGLTSYDFARYIDIDNDAAVEKKNGRVVEAYKEAIAAKVQEFEDYYASIDTTVYREDELGQLQLAYVVCELIIADATDIATVEGCIEAMKEVVAQLKTDAEYKVEEDFAAYKVSSKATMTALLNDADEDAVTEVASLISEANSKIDKAVSYEEIDSIVATYKATIAQLNTKAAAARLEAAKADGVKQIEEYFKTIDLTKYTVENLQVIANLINNAQNDVRAVTDASKISGIIDALKTAVAAVPVIEVVEDTNGCSNSVLVSSFLISALALCGVGLLAKKRKED